MKKAFRTFLEVLVIGAMFYIIAWSVTVLVFWHKHSEMTTREILDFAWKPYGLAMVVMMLGLLVLSAEKPD